MKAVLHELASAGAQRDVAERARRVVVVVREGLAVDHDARRAGHDRVGREPGAQQRQRRDDLNVEPGANWPNVARLRPPLPGPLAAARISPVLGRSATRALAGADVGQQRLRLGLQVQVEGELERCAVDGSARNSSRRPPSPSTASTFRPGVPRSVSSYLACSPESPATSPTW